MNIHNSSGDCYLQTSPASPCGSAVSPSDVFHNSVMSRNIPISRCATPSKRPLRKRKIQTTNNKYSRSFSMCSEDSNPFSASNAETGSDSGKNLT